MKKLSYLIVILVLFTACDNPKSLRYLFRAANRASQIDNDNPVKPKNDYLISFIEGKDTTGNVVFTALYTLPKDTNLFFWNISLNMPEKLGFNGRLDSCTVKTLFLKSVDDTANQPLFGHSYYFKRKPDGFYNITKQNITH